MLVEEVDPYARLRSLGMHAPPYVGYETVEEYIVDPSQATDTLALQGINSYYVGLRPLQEGLPKFRELGLSSNDVISYVEQNIPKEQRNSYALRIAEYAVAKYGAIFIVNPSGSILLEAVDGEMSKLAAGSQTPGYQGATNPLLEL